MKKKERKKEREKKNNNNKTDIFMDNFRDFDKH